MTEYDICERKHGGNPQSVEANRKAEPGKAPMREQIVRWARFFGKFTLEDVCEAFDVEKNAVSGRVTELRKNKIIEATGERRNGFGVYRVIDETAPRLPF